MNKKAFLFAILWIVVFILILGAAIFYFVFKTGYVIENITDARIENESLEIEEVSEIVIYEKNETTKEGRGFDRVAKIINP